MPRKTAPSTPLDVLDLLAEFPQALGDFGELRRYVRAVAQFSEFPGAQTVTRLKAQLKRTEDPVRQAELEYEIGVAETDSQTTIPRIVWGSILVAVYATYETSITNVLRFWCERIAQSAPFNPKAEREFLKSASAFANREIGIPLFENESIREAVFGLKALRNSFAHAAGKLPNRRTELHAALDAARSMKLEVAVVDGKWVASPRLAAYHLLQAERAYKAFSKFVIEAYVAHAQRADEA